MAQVHKKEDGLEKLLQDVVRVTQATGRLAEFKGIPADRILFDSNDVAARFDRTYVGQKLRAIQAIYPKIYGRLSSRINTGDLTEDDVVRVNEITRNIFVAERNAPDNITKRYISNDYSTVDELAGAISVALAAGRDDLLQSAIAAAELNLPRIMRKDFDKRLEQIASEAADVASMPRSGYLSDAYGDALRINANARNRLREIFEKVNPRPKTYRQPTLVGIPPLHRDPVDYARMPGQGRRRYANKR